MARPAHDEEVHTIPQVDRATDAPPVAAATILQGARSSFGDAVLQRKIARRLLQRKAGSAGETENAGSLHAAAEQGVTGSSQALPHLDQIQRSFGGHDVGGVQAFVGGPAAQASDQLGASAYAVGNSVAFKSSPDVHTAAHEAAHVVQQRAGVHLKGGVGEAGDSYEQHADAVADLVVSGKSAEPLLTQMAGGGAGGGALQKKEEAAPAKDKEKEADSEEEAAKPNPVVYDGVTRAVAADQTWLVAKPGRDKKALSVTAKLYKRELVSLIDMGSGEEANQKVDPKYHWWKVKVIKGANEGKEGWVRSHLLATYFKLKGTETSKTGKQKVGDGEMTIGLGQAAETDGYVNDEVDNTFNFTYKGKDAKKMRFLQFIWREIIGTDDKGKDSPVSATNTNSVKRSYQLTQGGGKDKYGTPGKANWNTDTGNGTDPFYESTGLADRTHETATMIDQPNQNMVHINSAFDNGAKSVVSRAHFSTFLVKDEKEVLAKGTVHVEWKFAKRSEAQEEKKGVLTGGQGPASALAPAELSDAFHEQFPAYKDLK